VGDARQLPVALELVRRGDLRFQMLLLPGQLLMLDPVFDHAAVVPALTGGGHGMTWSQRSISTLPLGVVVFRT
jgi:hypothetical protein